MPADGVTVAATPHPYADYCQLLGIDPEKGGPSLYQRVEHDYRMHTAQYWFVAVLANGLLWLQIILGASLTALSASPAPGTKTASIYLGVVTTVVAGLLTYFKSRNQPNRARQFRQALRNVRNQIEQNAEDVRFSDDPTIALRKYREIIKLYDDALNEAATNYPDLWVTMSDIKGFLNGRPGQATSEKNASAGNVTTGTATDTQPSPPAVGEPAAAAAAPSNQIPSRDVTAAESTT